MRAYRATLSSRWGSQRGGGRDHRGRGACNPRPGEGRYAGAGEPRGWEGGAGGMRVVRSPPQGQGWGSRGWGVQHGWGWGPPGGWGWGEGSPRAAAAQK